MPIDIGFMSGAVTAPVSAPYKPSPVSGGAAQLAEKAMALTIAGQVSWQPYLDPYTEETWEHRRAYRLMLRHPVIKPALWAKIYSVLSLDLQMTAASEDARDQEIADFCRYAYNDAMEEGVAKMAESILPPMLIDGTCIGERVWYQEVWHRGKWSGKRFFRSVKAKDIDTIQLKTDPFKNLIYVHGRDGDGHWHDWPARDFVILKHQPLFEGAGLSDFRAAYAAWWKWDVLNQLHDIHLGKFNGPFIVATYASGKDAEGRDYQDVLERNLANAQGNGWLVAPEGTVIELLNLAQGGEQFQSKLKDLEEKMALSISGAFLQMLTTSAGGDLRGDSNTQKSTSELFAWALSTKLAGAINTQMTPHLVDQNYLGADYPKASFGGVNYTDLMQEMELNGLAQQQGYKLSRKAGARKFGLQLATDPSDELVPVSQAQQQAPVQQPLGFAASAYNKETEAELFADLAAHCAEYPEDLGLLQTFAAGDWAPYVGARGGKGWKNAKSGKVVYGAAQPGASREAHPDLPGTKDGKADVDALATHIQGLKANPSLTSEHVQDLAGKLKSLKVDELKQLKAKLGVKGGSTKAEHVAKVAAHIGAPATPTKTAPPTTPLPFPESSVAGLSDEAARSKLGQLAHDGVRSREKVMPNPADFAAFPVKPETERAILGAVASEQQGYNEPSLKQVYDAAKKAAPALTLQEFHGTLGRLRYEDKVSLSPFTRAISTLEHPQTALPMSGEIMGFVGKGKTPAEQKPAEPTKPAAAPNVAELAQHIRELTVGGKPNVAALQGLAAKLEGTTPEQRVELTKQLVEALAPKAKAVKAAKPAKVEPVSVDAAHQAYERAGDLSFPNSKLNAVIRAIPSMPSAELAELKQRMHLHPSTKADAVQAAIIGRRGATLRAHLTGDSPAEMEKNRAKLRDSGFNDEPLLSADDVKPKAAAATPAAPLEPFTPKRTAKEKRPLESEGAKAVVNTYERSATLSADDVKAAVDHLDELGKDELLQAADHVGLVGQDGKSAKDVRKAIAAHITQRVGGNVRSKLLDPVKPAKVEAPPSPKATAAIATVKGLYDSALSADYSHAQAKAKIAELGKSLTTDELKAVAKARNVYVKPGASKKALLDEIERHVTERRESFENKQGIGQ